MSTHEYTWNNNEPVSSSKAGLGATEIAKSRKMTYERVAVDHNMGGVLTASSNQDGTHKQVTLQTKTSSPAALAGAGKLYAKTINGIVELCYLDNNGNEVQLTVDGTLPFGVEPIYAKYSNSVDRVIGSTYTTVNFDTQVEAENGTMTDGVFSPSTAGFFIINCSFADGSDGSYRLRKTDGGGTTTTLYSWPMSDGMNFFHIAWIANNESLFVEMKSGTVESGSYFEVIKA